MAWGAFELGSAIYDVYQASKTVADKNATRGEKIATVALAAGSLLLPGGGYASGGKLAMSYSRSQLQHGFKHAADFGISGKMSNETLAAFSSAVENHVQASGTRAIRGTYRGQAVVHHVDPSSGLNVMQKANGEFLSGWKLSSAQLDHVLKSGKLGGGK